MDVFGPLQRMKAGNKYILVIMDYLTKWPEAYPLKNATANAVVDCGLDNGSNFISKTVRQFCETIGVTKIPFCQECALTLADLNLWPTPGPILISPTRTFIQANLVQLS